MPVIAMTREIGTRGAEVAAGLHDRLGIAIVHHDVVEHDIAERSGLEDWEVHRYLEGEATLFERWSLDHKRMSHFTAQEILELAEKGNVLIRGWGANFLLKDIPHVIRVRICAPMAYRVRVHMERAGIDDVAVARREIERDDEAHNSTLKRMFGINPEDPSLYAVAFNTAHIPVADCVDHIVRLAESDAFQETPKSRSAMLDQVIQTRVQDALDRRFGAKSSENGFEGRVFASKVLLTGATTDESVIVEAVRLLQSVEGVTGVECKVRHVAFVPHAQ